MPKPGANTCCFLLPISYEYNYIIGNCRKAQFFVLEKQLMKFYPAKNYPHFSLRVCICWLGCSFSSPNSIVGSFSLWLSHCSKYTLPYLCNTCEFVTLVNFGAWHYGSIAKLTKNLFWHHIGRLVKFCTDKNAPLYSIPF